MSLCERGIRTFETPRYTLDLNAFRFEIENSPARRGDPTHGIGLRDFVPNGATRSPPEPTVMIEVRLSAIGQSDGERAILPEVFADRASSSRCRRSCRRRM
jgi:3-deoxy-D-arabino-heptulosonate 7-phosphate (DAHP) synthase